ncbi:ABC transporter ATP-binding protein [bacterium]|nr:ABC transporter ATP-binding protein [bacterium]
MISLKKITKKYADLKDTKTVLNDISFDVEEGGFVSIIGTSGSGKTTLLNILGGLDTKFEGDLSVFSKNLKKMDDNELSLYRNQNIGFVFQNFNLLNHLTAAENVMLPARFQKNSIDLQKRLDEVFEIIKLPDKQNSYPSELSGGQRQRVAIARALFNSPKILLCDEPTGNLDRDTGVEVLSFFKSLNEKDNITVIIITHEKHIAEMTKRVIRLENGNIISDVIN